MTGEFSPSVRDMLGSLAQGEDPGVPAPRSPIRSRFMIQDHVTAALASEDRRFAAMAASDLAALDETLADDLHYTHANGMVEDKKEFLRRIRSGERDYRSVQLIYRAASAQPGFVAVFGRIKVEVMRKAGLLENMLDYTAIYRDGDPRLFAWSAVKAMES